jgi:hypothetical protein
MCPRRALASVAAAAILAAVPAQLALASTSVGSSEQIAWVRRAASNFVQAELAGNGAGVCLILNAPLRYTRHGRTCAQRWDAKLAAQLHTRGKRSALRAEARAIRSATVIVNGYTASLQLPKPLLGGPNHFLWTENCWMLEG